MSEKTIKINKTIEINDTEIGLRKLPTILSAAIVTSRFYCPTSCMDKYSGALEIKMGDFMYVIPKMMEADDKRRFVVQVKNISSTYFREGFSCLYRQ